MLRRFGCGLTLTPSNSRKPADKDFPAFPWTINPGEQEKRCYELMAVAAGLGAVNYWPSAFLFSAMAGAYCGEHHVFG